MKRRENQIENKIAFNNDSKTLKNVEKKVFDKKKHRLKKYSNKYKVEQRQERMKLAVLRDYYEEFLKDQHGRRKGTETKVETLSGHDASKPKKSPNYFDVIRKEYERKKEDKKRKKEERLRIIAEREEALRKYKEKKMQAYKKLSKKTKKGQPVIKERIELLLQKIQQDKGN
ncbi:thyroid transcription factor 1-associated protein 26 homolog [Vespa crabro]|uniref:thyroid transcription factor 1-associated protein 26 homolog n=1 Tax=Vespa crabro TaxID=7445 RepID=UPI001F00FB1D|nr:thyroid transcription factor 1-associated protein 26 homolog [Vespa crabro]